MASLFSILTFTLYFLFLSLNISTCLFTGSWAHWQHDWNSCQSGRFIRQMFLKESTRLAALFPSLISSFSPSFLRCPVFRRLREEAEKRKRPSWNELKSRKADRESPGDAKQHSTATKNSRDQPEPGMINPAFEESEDGTSSAATAQTTSTQRSNLISPLSPTLRH